MEINENNNNYLQPDLANQDYEQENFNYNNRNNINNNTYKFQRKIQIQDNQSGKENENDNNQNLFLERPIKPERMISYFYGNDFLVDAVLKGDNFELPFHKIVLCSASDFLLNYFKINKEMTEKANVNLPEIMKSSFSQGDKKECLDKIFKYCYNNQDIKSIESDITQNNCFTFLELAHCLQIKSLCSNLEKIIIKNYLKDDNMIKISEESNMFELEELRKECSNKIKSNLGNIKNLKKEIIELKYNTFKDIISSDELDIEQEKDVADLVIEYIKSRRNIPEEIKENIPNNENNLQNQENLENNQQNEEPPQNQENQNQNENNENNGNNENNENNQNQENNNNNNVDDPYNKWKKHLEELEKNSKKKRLTPEEEKMLILCIRFSYLSHADLIELTNEPIMENYKDLILQGLSARLDTYENTNDKKTIINLTPRHYLRGQQISINRKMINNNNINNNYNEENIEQSNNINNFNNINNNQLSRTARNIGQNNLGSLHKFNDQRNFANSQSINSRQNKINNDKNINYFMKDETEMPSYYDDNNINNNMNNSNSNYLGRDILNIDEMNSRKKKMAIMAKSSPGPYPPQDPRISQNFFRSQRKVSYYNPIFKYTYDFDENGALYYLGTKGRKYQYRNPHELNLVTAFGSSVSKGQISDFVGRNLVNLRTENEENSFFGVDLGDNRTLVPTAYSIRNRNSSTHVMLCWNLEASNDKVHFEILDTRIFSNIENPQIHQKLERERNLLKEPGCTSTWGISRKIKEKFPDGFRYFLIKQIDKNSNGSYNLTNSGFELYGEGKGSGWIFN